jgi:hypothetical protein
MTFSRKLSDLFWALLAAFASCYAMGCGGAEARGPGGFDSGVNPCLAEGYYVVQLSSLTRQGKTVSPAEQALEICVGWSAADDYGSADECVRALSQRFAREQAEVECTTRMTAAECTDAAGGYRGASGLEHRFGVRSAGGGSHVLDRVGVTSGGCPGMTVYCAAEIYYSCY